MLAEVSGIADAVQIVAGAYNTSACVAWLAGDDHDARKPCVLVRDGSASWFGYLQDGHHDTGADRVKVASWPEALIPQHTTVPPARNAHLWGHRPRSA